MHELSSAQMALGYLRIWDIIGDKKKGIAPLIPVGRTTWLNGVREGKYPQPVKLGERITCWKKSDILELIESMGSAA